MSQKKLKGVDRSYTLENEEHDRTIHLCTIHKLVGLRGVLHCDNIFPLERRGPLDYRNTNTLIVLILIYEVRKKGTTENLDGPKILGFCYKGQS